MRHVFKSRMCVLLVGLLGVFACGGSDEPDKKKPNENPQATIGPAGGEVQALGVLISIPPGALAEETAISVEMVGSTAQEGLVHRSATYRFEPAGTQFALPVAVTFDFSGESDAAVYWSVPGDDSTFERIGGEIEFSKITAQVSHFSVAFVASEGEEEEPEPDVEVISEDVEEGGRIPVVVSDEYVYWVERHFEDGGYRSQLTWMPREGGDRQSLPKGPKITDLAFVDGTVYWLEGWSPYALRSMADGGGEPVDIVEVGADRFFLDEDSGFFFFPKRGGGIQRIHREGGEPMDVADSLHEEPAQVVQIFHVGSDIVWAELAKPGYQRVSKDGGTATLHLESEVVNQFAGDGTRLWTVSHTEETTYIREVSSESPRYFSQHAIYGIQLHGGFLYFTDNVTAMRLPVDGSGEAGSLFTDKNTGPFICTVDDDYVYINTHKLQRIRLP